MSRLIPMVALVATLVGLTNLWADEPKRHHEEIGKVTKVFADSKDAKLTDIEVSSHGHPFATIRAGEQTKVTRAGEPAKLSEVAVGQHLKAVVDDDENALTIDIRPPKK